MNIKKNEKKKFNKHKSHHAFVVCVNLHHTPLALLLIINFQMFYDRCNTVRYFSAHVQ